MRSLLWTDRAQADLAATHYASLVVAKLIAAAERLRNYPESGRVVPEFAYPCAK